MQRPIVIVIAILVLTAIIVVSRMLGEPTPHSVAVGEPSSAEGQAPNSQDHGQAAGGVVSAAPQSEYRLVNPAGSREMQAAGAAATVPEETPQGESAIGGTARAKSAVETAGSTNPLPGMPLQTEDAASPGDAAAGQSAYTGRLPGEGEPVVPAGPLPGEGDSQVPAGSLPGEGEPQVFGPLPGENEPDVLGPLPGEGEPEPTGPLPGE